MAVGVLEKNPESGCRLQRNADIAVEDPEVVIVTCDDNRTPRIPPRATAQPPYLVKPFFEQPVNPISPAVAFSVRGEHPKTAEGPEDCLHFGARVHGREERPIAVFHSSDQIRRAVPPRRFPVNFGMAATRE